MQETTGSKYLVELPSGAAAQLTVRHRTGGAPIRFAGAAPGGPDQPQLLSRNQSSDSSHNTFGRETPSIRFPSVSPEYLLAASHVEAFQTHLSVWPLNDDGDTMFTESRRTRRGDLKEINLPSRHVYTTPPIDLQNIRQDQIEIVDGKKRINLGSIDFGEANKDLPTIRENASKIVDSAVGIEAQMDDILVDFLFQSDKGRNHRRDFFRHQFLESATILFSSKKELLQDIVNTEQLLDGKKKNILQKNLKLVIRWRNSFAHGHLEYDGAKGWHLRYFSGGHQDDVLDDDYWTHLETVFHQTLKLLDEAQRKLENSASS